MRSINVHAVTFVAACLVLTAALTTNAQTPEAPKQKPPDSTGVFVSRGHTLFLSSCAPCHGADAKGDDGPNLHNLGLPDDVISSTVSNGIKDEMPSFSKKLKGDDLKAVVAYVHSLQ